MTGLLRPVALATACIAALSLPSRSGELPASGESARIAELGVQIPALEERPFYSKATMLDIRDNLHAGYVRTGWVPGWFKLEKKPWIREDRAMHVVCTSGLKVMVITPTPKEDADGLDDLVGEADAFFARYTKREPGCLRYAEIANETDIAKNGFSSVDAYAAYYERIAPIPARYGIEVITSGTSGKDLPWTFSLASILRSAAPKPPVSGFGFHPYGVSPKSMASATLAMRQAAGKNADGALPEVYVTELGLKNGDDLYAAIVNLAHATPAITIFEYETQPGIEREYGLKDNPALYQAMQRAWQHLHGADAAPL
ncbi:MAG TPA: hypothetical protein VK760_02965 [Candidatus Acidoferrales bacterium]|nr:hypothetical protein [Candidatus Acidoferrales bacterium]